MNLSLFDQKGGVWMGLFTFVVIGLSIYATLAGKEIPGGVVAVYGAALAAFAANAVAKTVRNKRARD